jgi:hypothetical protein
MGTQPRTEANGQVIEYGPMYKLLHAISHGKPVVAVTIANGDYHTPPNLMRLAMAEAAANNASYLSWPTWPQDQRQRMIAGIRPQADFLRRNQELLNDAPHRADVVLYLPFQQWVKTDRCAAGDLAATLTKENIQYRVISEDDLESFAKEPRRPPLLVESRAVFTPCQQPTVAMIEKQGTAIITADQPDWPDWLAKRRRGASVRVEGPPTVRVVVHDQSKRTIVHLYNLNVRRLSSFEDKVTPVTDVRLTMPLTYRPRSVTMQTADDVKDSAPLKYEPLINSGPETLISITVPRLEISAILVIER